MSQDDSTPLVRDIAPFGVRMPPDLKERVQTAAKSNNRSMNAEIVATLEEKYPAQTFDPLAALSRYMDLAAVVMLEGASKEDCKKALEEMSAIERIYRQVMGKDI